MRTINDLVNFMTENCYQKFTLTADGTELQLSNGFGLKCTDEKFHIGYNERGTMESIQKFKTETEAVVAFYKRIKSDKLLRRHCIGILKSKESFTELTDILKSNHIRFEQDSILYAENDTRYRVFVFGCDVKKIDGLKDLSKTNNNSWTDNKILLEYNENRPSKDIFQAVCDEIGNHYVKKGFKYSRSKPKIVYKDELLKVEICFWSSKSNTTGRNITLEILPNFYSIEVIKQKLSKSNSKITNGYLLGHTVIFNEKYTNNPKLQKVIQIYGDVIEKEDVHANESRLRHNHYCNIDKIDELKFNKIISFIDTKILPWIELLKSKEGVLKFTEDSLKSVLSSLNGKSTNSDFIQYCNLTFPDIDIREKLPK